MKLQRLIYITLAALLASCNDDIIPSQSSDANGAIVLRAGISDGGVGVMARAGAETHHSTPGHVAFSDNTQLRLRVDGTWKDHDPEDVTKTTTGTIGSIVADTDEKHRDVDFSSTQMLYWDDYGSSDPANMSPVDGNGRDKGLTIYAVAIDGEGTAPTVSSWTSQAWNVGAPSDGVINQNVSNGWKAKDLLTSNNVQTENGALPYSTDGTYKFEQRASGKLLEFTHTMTKLTVNLIAHEGFPGYTTLTPNAGKFQHAPKVTFLGFNYTGTVSVEAKTSTPIAGTANFEAWRDNGEAWPAEGRHTSQLTALVFPGNQFADNTDILKLEVDGNTLYVNATKINAANTEASKTFEQGKNYIFNIIVDKTGISVSATIKSWDDVEAEEEAPKINVNEVYGHEPGTAFEHGFTLYRSETITDSYIGTGDKANVAYSAGTYTMTPQLYWPDHSTHYFFRGVWPMVDSVDGSSAQLGPTTAQVKANAVDVANVAYKQGYYPSDLMIARPLIAAETATDEACKVHGGTQGICATEGDIRMNFRYMMSKVRVELKSSDPGDDDYIAFDENTTVEILGGYTSGAIKLSDCTVDFGGKTKTNYLLHNVANDDYDSFHDAIVPQSLEGLKFRITTKNANDKYDTYEAVIKNIMVSEGSNPAALITAWASGKSYTYTLKITKTAVNVTATLTDWVPAEASTDIWF